MGRQKPQKFNSCISERRQVLNLTQRELANEIGVTETTIRNWEKGHLEWLNKVALLCELFDCSPEVLVQNFRRLREGQSLTQFKIAQALDVAETTVAKWEKGNFDWANKAARLSQALKCPLQDLYRTNPEAISTVKKSKSSAPSGEEILSKLSRNSQTDRTSPEHSFLPFLKRISSIVYLKNQRYDPTGQAPVGISSQGTGDDPKENSKNLEEEDLEISGVAELGDEQTIARSFGGRTAVSPRQEFIPSISNAISYVVE